MATNREEIDANGFAAALSMPEGLLAAAARAQFSRSTSRRLTRDDLVSALARNFDVSTGGDGLPVGQPRDALPLIRWASLAVPQGSSRAIGRHHRLGPARWGVERVVERTRSISGIQRRRLGR